MFNKNKIEVIPFKDFMSRPAACIQKEIPLQTNIYGFLPGMSLERFFDMSPQVSGLYAVVLGVGAFAMLSHLIEVTTAKNGFNNVAYVIETVTRFILPMGTFGFMIWVLFKII
ncbi:hypothetical protein [Metabacillus fastidiosus]|uniref:hypothetical protein n=1 Tax=Metabacillus fastidiosus TaxID=1458 RepID=UPI002E232793|nr:hypothetical protein [Metabacillus fastidiosus]